MKTIRTLVLTFLATSMSSALATDPITLATARAYEE